MTTSNQEFIDFYNLNNEVKLQNLKCINLLAYFETQNQFQEFILTKRVIPFLFLKVIYSFFDEKNYNIGFKNHNYYFEKYNEEIDDYYDDEYDVLDIGPSIIKRIFSGKEIFDFLLQEISFSNIILETYIDKYKEEFIEKGECNEKKKNSFSEPIIILNSENKQLLLVEQDIYCSENIYNIIQGLLIHHKKFIEPFLYSSFARDTIPHSQYVDWLLNWFPGKIKINQLS